MIYSRTPAKRKLDSACIFLDLTGGCPKRSEKCGRDIKNQRPAAQSPGLSAKQKRSNTRARAAMDKEMTKPPRAAFSGYQKFVIAVLAFLQFTIILDFMIISPLGAIV